VRRRAWLCAHGIGMSARFYKVQKTLQLTNDQGLKAS